MIGMMKIIWRDDYKIIPRSGSVLPLVKPIRKPKYLILRFVGYVNLAVNHTCHSLNSPSDQFHCNLRSVVVTLQETKTPQYS